MENTYSEQILNYTYDILCRDGFTITPVLGMLVAIACGLSLVVVAIIIVLRIRPGMSQANRRRDGSIGGGRPGSDRSDGNLNNHTHYLATHVHLPLSQTSCGVNNGETLDECINLEEKDPDVIPSNKGKFSQHARSL